MAEGPADGQRMTGSGVPIVPPFDGFRAIGIFGIVILHTLQIAGIVWDPDGTPIERLLWAADIGQTSLNALFIVSGFVIYLPIAARKGQLGDWRAFVLRRGARLFPAYWLVLVLMLVLIAVLPFESGLLVFPSAADLALTFTTLEVPSEMFRFTYYLGFGMNRAIWTLSLDITFYILLILLAVRFYRRPLVGLGIAVVMAIGWRLAFTNLAGISTGLGFDPDPRRISDLYLAAEIQFPFWAMSFAVGMCLAQVFVRIKDGTAPALVKRFVGVPMLAASIAGLVVLIVAVAVIRPESVHYSPVAGPVYTALLGLFMLGTITAPESVQRPFSNRPARFLGDISYGAYLIHLVLLTLLLEFASLPRGTYADALLWIAIVAPLSALWGWGSSRLVEQPIRRRASAWARSMGAKPERLPASASPP